MNKDFNEQNSLLGLGLRAPHIPHILKTKPEVDYFEIISENFMGQNAKANRNLEAINEIYPIVLHGVSMNLGSADPLDWDYLKGVKALAQKIDAPFISDHLCWTGVEGEHLHDLLPLPHNEKMIKYLSQRIKEVQDFFEIPFGIENLSSYGVIPQSDLTEMEFYTGVIEESGCWAMLDLNNIVVSSKNHDFKSKDYVDKVNWDKVLQCHIAGHSASVDGVIIDTHDEPVCDNTWELYKYAWQKSSGFKTLLEWDAKIPSFERVFEELNKSKEFRG
jgi:uncharacterized protein (UPF0276 family)